MPPPNTGRKGRYFAKVAKRLYKWKQQCVSRVDIIHHHRPKEKKKKVLTEKKESPGPKRSEGRMTVAVGWYSRIASSPFALVLQLHNAFNRHRQQKNISFQLQPQAPDSLGSYTLRVSSNGTNVNHPPYTFFTSSFSHPPRPVFLQRLHLLVAPHQQARQRNDGRSSFKSLTQFWDRGRRGDVYRGGREDLGSQSRQFGMD